ncbi:MAG: hypothetical protein JWO38_67 [Gemmataceae bacterium]|nr:hypothetical protein [Gemmataceae bacterium]
MQVNLPNLEWRVLREVARTRRPAIGRALRLDMNRRTKDGSFLTTLVRQGLLEVVTAGKTPFDATYRLTERGKHAAEYGVYEVEWAEFKAQSEKAKA